MTAFKTYQALLQRIDVLEQALEKARPVTEKFNLATPTNTITLEHAVNSTAPVWVIYESLPQRKTVDFTVEGNIFTWVNTTDPFITGDIEITYFRA